MKKEYIKPVSEAVVLPNLMQTMPVSGGSGKSTSGDEGGWSKKFWGLTDEDEEEKNFDWE